MPVTRRQSGRLPLPSQEPATAGEVGPGDSDDELSDWPESSSEDGSDWEEGTRRKRSKPAGGASASRGDGSPHAKRPRKAATGSPPNAPRLPRGARLSILPTLPLDILFEIFGLLDPSDLLNLARANKPFRNMLMTRQAITIWKSALKQVPGGAPDCPSDISEPRWANLLFGGTKCQECGTSNVHRVDFALRRRVCTKCMKRNLIYAGTFKRKFPELDESILALIPYTKTGGWAHGYESKNKFYWEADVYAMAEAYAQLQKGVYMRKAGAKDALDKFRKERTVLVDDIMKDAHKHSHWFRQRAYHHSLAVEERKQARYHEVVRRFRALGYEQRDIVSICPKVMEQDRELTDRIWLNIRLKLEPEILRAIEMRIARERRILIRDREEVVTRVYDDYKKTLVPVEWLYLPTEHEIHRMPEFAALINAPSHILLDRAACKPGVDALPGFTSTRANLLKDSMLEILQNQDQAAPDYPTADAPAASASVMNVDRTSLVTSVFRCASHPMCSPSPLISWRGVMSHTCWITMFGHDMYMLGHQDDVQINGPKLEFSEKGSAAAASLLAVLGLDVNTTLPEELDHIDARFVCLQCPVSEVGDGGKGGFALSWRQCISHYVKADASTHPLSGIRWHLLRGAELAAIKDDEDFDLSYTQHMWSCNCCSSHFGNLQTHPGVTRHVRVIHDIEDPQEGRDFFHAIPHKREFRRPCRYAVRPPPQTQATTSGTNL